MQQIGVDFLVAKNQVAMQFECIEQMQLRRIAQVRVGDT